MKGDIEEKIYSTFASVASSLGYNEVHGRIIAALLVEDKMLSLQELSEKTGYSVPSVSLSLDLLELVGLVRKIKNVGDRKLYVKKDGDIIEGLRNALIVKVGKDIAYTLMEFEKYNKDEKTDKMVKKLENEIERLQKYVNELSKVEIPKKN